MFEVVAYGKCQSFVDYVEFFPAATLSSNTLVPLPASVARMNVSVRFWPWLIEIRPLLLSFQLPTLLEDIWRGNRLKQMQKRLL